MVINLIPFSTILSIALEKYIKDNEHLFVNDNNVYILTAPFKINVLHSYITNTIDQVISRLTSDNIFILGECHIYNNWRLQLGHNQVNPNKKHLLDKHSTIKYILKENNIKINELRFNHIVDTYFNKQFKIVKNNITFLKHRHLTEDDLIYIFNLLFSTKNLNIVNSDNNILEKPNTSIYLNYQDKIPKKYIKSLSCLIEEQLTNIR